MGRDHPVWRLGEMRERDERVREEQCLVWGDDGH